jgi:hypothetical protein
MGTHLIGDWIPITVIPNPITVHARAGYLPLSGTASLQKAEYRLRLLYDPVF